jgi:four helix bundle protein
MQNDREKFKKDFIKRLIQFSLKILKFSQEKLNKESTMWPIKDQLIRCSTSIGANVVEAKSSSSKKDYIKFFEIALKSANETKYWLFLIQEHQKQLSREANELIRETEEISNILASSVLTLKNKKK